MKVSLDWLQSYIDTPLDAETTAEMLTSLGLEVEGIEVVESIKGGLKDYVVGEVVECEKHPDADKLSVTKVDTGLDGLSQIVCGAPNVAKGQKVIVALPGAIVYGKDDTSFQIKKAKIRGVASEGMICAQDELGLGDDHSGILVLDPAAVVGTPAADYFKLKSDSVIEIGLTPNRTDASAHLGVARDLSAGLRIRNGVSAKIILPETSITYEKNSSPFDVTIEDTGGCIRYSGVYITGVQVTESPEWLKNRLIAIGLRPINAIVDITNFVLHELGQPLHAFDAGKIHGQGIRVKMLPSETKFTTLDNVERKLTGIETMICDNEDRPLCIGGVFGGADSGVTDRTQNIFLESATFTPTRIRRTAQAHGLKTDASRTFERGTDPNNCVFALERAASLILTITGGKIEGGLIDIYHHPVIAPEIKVRYLQVNKKIGANISPDEIKEILQALHITILSQDAEGLVVSVPTDKLDVLREVDVIEEILRVYGFDKVPITSALSSSITPMAYPDPFALKNKVSDYLQANGFNEIMGMSLSQSRYYEKALPVAPDRLVHINNTSNSHLNVMRYDMLPTMLESIAHNHNRQQQNLRLFEFGKTYRVDDGKYVESNHLALAVTGKWAEQSWNAPLRDSDFFILKSIAGNILASLGLHEFTMSQSESSPACEYGADIRRGKTVFGSLGKISAALLPVFELKHEVYYADLYWDEILNSVKPGKVKFREISRFPSVTRDLALVLDKKVSFEEIEKTAYQTEKVFLKSIRLFDIYINEKQLGEGVKSCAVSFTFLNESKTLSEQEIDGLMSKLVTAFETKLGAKIRS